MTATVGTQAESLAAAPIAHPHISYRPDIDGLRAVAVLAVLAFHAFPSVLRGGFIGVDIFFVISGYLISKVILATLERDAFSIADFYSRRIRRIFPALVLVLACCMVFAWRTMLADDLAALAKHTVGGAGFVSNLVLWSEAGYFDKASETKPLLHLWSLGIEEQFYLFWPILLWGAWRLRLSLIAVIAATGLASFILNLAGIHEHATATFYSPLSRAWELMIGGGVAYWTSEQGSGDSARAAAFLQRMRIGAGAFRGPWIRAVASSLGMIILAYALVRIDSRRPFPGTWALLPTVGSALLIAAGPMTWINRHVLGSRPMVAIGLISYPLYLWHWPLLVAARTLRPEGLSISLKLIMLCVAFVLAWATYRFVERPLRLNSRKSLKVATLATAMTATGVFAVVTWAQGGFPSRYPEIVRRATEYDLDAYRSSLRNKRCFMELGQDATQYAPECIDQGTKPLWVLWGDSAAAAMYTGFRSLASESGTIRLAQFSSSACPPMMGSRGVGNAACLSNNEWTLAQIKKLRPSVVVMAAMWNEYDKGPLTATIDKLKAVGVGRIILLGQPPAWVDTPSRITFGLWSQDPLHRTPPAHLDYRKYGMGQADYRPGGPDRRTQSADEFLAKIAKAEGVEFVSINQRMCDASGCLMRESESSGTPFYLDVVHLTPAGSVFAAHAIRSDLGIPK